MTDHRKLLYEIPPQIFRNSGVAPNVKNNKGSDGRVWGGWGVLLTCDGDAITAAPESQSLASTCPLGSLLEVYYSLVAISSECVCVGGGVAGGSPRLPLSSK